MKKHIIEVPEVQKIGVYAIRNKITNKYYIGSSVNIYNRMKSHRNHIEGGYFNLLVNPDLKKYGVKSFEFIILETYDDNIINDMYLRDREKYFMDKYKSLTNGYNINFAWTNGHFKKNELLKCPIISTRNKKHDFINLTMAFGIKERLKAVEIDNKTICNIIMNELEKREKSSKI